MSEHSGFGGIGVSPLPPAYCLLPTAHCSLFTVHCSATCCSLLAACCPLPSAHCPQTACTPEFALRSTAIQRICFRFVSPAKPPTTQAARAHVRIFCAARDISRRHHLTLPPTSHRSLSALFISLRHLQPSKTDLTHHPSSSSLHQPKPFTTIPPYHEG